ncbi:MAG: squalene synthase HpnC [Ignavibacteria bacterium CG_4_8_14_3_um_filter_37_9]|nr:squalene synthase HpnC [Ignavibacteria bacterium]PIS44132.1 MAG: squalene synthase HpnC [Ignavibacteria bacterium CG08_land_8_20_14_0_20_37_9]PIW99404.1 MAG: squalene synthase HpnC [Ignavibacteria bacterium CG_4_8_14_3_um_filter_37_9]PIX93763.1 MAG: squalene synthase HpnC [Ignavibacteria bacterium CG_4_10_14_3_um_filter_37_18]PJC61130.1 MAG: squalene synthase HpnC [Ignavibacteria bacterium CG_4_9_14_0_2_um_filter_37_13]
MNYTTKDLQPAYQEAIQFAKKHYENFPVVTFLIQKKLRKDVAIIYWFARTADDIADEGDYSVEQRLERLARFEKRLQNLLNGIYADPFDLALAETINERKLSQIYFFKLLKAFRSDILFHNYQDFSDLQTYCDSSANPIGRLLLELHDIRDPKVLKLSDNICSALQLTNFYQDFKFDIKKGRNYIPINDLIKLGLDENNFTDPVLRKEFCEVVKLQIDRITKLFSAGEELLNYLPKKLRIEIGWTILGGREILKKIESAKYNVLMVRPSLKKYELILLLLKSFSYAKRFS